MHETLFNPPDTKDRRKVLRNRTTEPEQILWSYLRKYQIDGYKFRRQHGIGPYIVDFYCPMSKLVIEVDGDSHFEPGSQEYDKERTAFFQENGIIVIRFTNLDVRENISGVIEIIKETLRRNADPLT